MKLESIMLAIKDLLKGRTSTEMREIMLTCGSRKQGTLVELKQGQCDRSRRNQEQTDKQSG